MSEVDQDLATCYHEAAHAVFAVMVVGGEVRYVEVEEGYCAARTEGRFTPAGAWRSALYTLSGSFAEQLAIWGEIRPDSWEEFVFAVVVEAEDEWLRGDRYELMECLHGIGEPEEEYPDVITDTQDEVRRLWPEITAVAGALRTRRRLEGDEVMHILESARKEDSDA